MDPQENRESFISSSNPLNSSTNTKSDGEKKNLWASLLNSVTQRNSHSNAHLLVLGDRSAGKRSLIKSMNKPFLKKLGIIINDFDDIGSDFSLFESSYLYVKDNMEGDAATDS